MFAALFKLHRIGLTVCSVFTSNTPYDKWKMMINT